MFLESSESFINSSQRRLDKRPQENGGKNKTDNHVGQQKLLLFVLLLKHEQRNE